MRFSTRAFALTLLAAGTASAQPYDTQPEPPPPVEPPPPMEPEPPAVPPQPPQPPQPPADERAQAPAEPPTTVRPEGLAFGIGIGFSIPGAIDTPNLASVRVRLPSGLTFEPFATIGTAKEETNAGGIDSEDSVTTFGLGALVRVPVVQRGKVDLEVLASGLFANTNDNPEGNNNSTSATSFNIGWGLGVSYWLTRHWNLTFSATNELIEYDRTNREDPIDDTTNSRLELKAEFAPRVFVMIHLFN